MYGGFYTQEQVRADLQISCLCFDFLAGIRQWSISPTLQCRLRSILMHFIPCDVSRHPMAIGLAVLRVYSRVTENQGNLPLGGLMLHAHLHCLSRTCLVPCRSRTL